jgi:ankyrin repeat protein
MQVLEMLVRDPRFGLTVGCEIGLVPDISPPYYPRRHPTGDDVGLTWAWCRLSPMEFAILHRRVDVAVLLCRLGADLLHTVDHVSVRPPEHYTVTDHCFRNLTPLHLCALFDFRLAAAALLHEASEDNPPVVRGEHARPQKQALLSASDCMQCWATVDTPAGDPAQEPWLWRNLTPLHLALIVGSTDTAELFIEASSPAALDRVCFNLDSSGDSERSFSSLLLAFERGYKDLHRRIAKKFPSC